MVSSGDQCANCCQPYSSLSPDNQRVLKISIQISGSQVVTHPLKIVCEIFQIPATVLPETLTVCYKCAKLISTMYQTHARYKEAMSLNSKVYATILHVKTTALRVEETLKMTMKTIGSQTIESFPMKIDGVTHQQTSVAKRPVFIQSKNTISIMSECHGKNKKKQMIYLNAYTPVKIDPGTKNNQTLTHPDILTMSKTETNLLNFDTEVINTEPVDEVSDMESDSAAPHTGVEVRESIKPRVMVELLVNCVKRDGATVPPLPAIGIHDENNLSFDGVCPVFGCQDKFKASLRINVVAHMQNHGVEPEFACRLCRLQLSYKQDIQEDTELLRKHYDSCTKSYSDEPIFFSDGTFLVEHVSRNAYRRPGSRRNKDADKKRANNITLPDSERSMNLRMREPIWYRNLFPQVPLSVAYSMDMVVLKCVDYCGEIFYNGSPSQALQKIKDHNAKEHGEGNANRKCPHCRLIFSGPACAGYLEVHVNRIHKKITNIDCAVCGKANLESDRALKTHALRHLSQKEKEEFVEKNPMKSSLCPECGILVQYHNWVSEHSALSSHIRKVHGPKKPFKKSYKKLKSCIDCSFTSFSPKTLSLHKLVHDEKAETFECEMCGEQFKRKILLGRHRTKCAEAVGFGCEECPRRFNKKPSLMVHIVSVHQRTPEYAREKTYPGKTITESMKNFACRNRNRHRAQTKHR